MHKMDMASETTVARAISATLSGVTPSAGNVIDVRDFAAVTFAFLTGAVTAAGTAGFAVKLQESDTTAAADFADVAAKDIVGTLPTVESNDDDNLALAPVAYTGSKRYVRAVATGTTNTNAVLNGVAILQRPRYAAAGAAAADIAAT